MIRKIRTLLQALAIALLAGAAPLAAQDASSPAATPSTPAEPDPERMVIAMRLVDLTLPVGTVRQTMRSTMAATASLGGDIPAEEEDSKEARRARHEARTGRPLARSPDAADTAAAMTPDSMMDQMAAAMEPRMRAALAQVYARRYDVAQLRELESFFATPTGAAYATGSLTLMEEPEMIAAIQQAAEEVMRGLLGPMLESTAEAAAAATAAAAAGAAGWKVE